MAAKKKAKEVSQTETREEDEIDVLIGQINSQLKEGKVVRASDIDGSYLLRRPTGITSLDIEIGGGFPARGVTQLVGAENSGKTALAYQVCKNVQQIYGEETRIALLMVEGFDKAFAKSIGFHVGYSDHEIAQMAQAHNMALTPEQIAYMKKEVGKVYYCQYPTAESLLQAALGLIASNRFHVVLLDSLAAMETDAESEKTLEELTRGGKAKVLSMFFRKLSAINYDTSVILINQLLDNMDAQNMYAKKYVIPGGRALRHASALTLVLSSGERYKETVKWGGDKKEIMFGKDINFIVDKGKAGCHDGGKGSYTFYNGEMGRPFGFDTTMDLLMCAVYYNVIEQSGANYSYNGEKVGYGKEAAAEVLRSNPEFAEKIRQEVFAKTKVKFLVKE